MKSLFVLSISFLACGDSYRIVGTEEEELAFRPFETGFVGSREKSNAFPASPSRSNRRSYQGASNSRLFNCPQMIGPLDKGEYYCVGKHAGYCDRRSGTCYCNNGYQGASCEECDPTHHRIGELCYKKVRCPNDCSNAGTCDSLSGRCSCNSSRVGEDCSRHSCKKYHEYCTHCNEVQCLTCIEGYSPEEDEGCTSCQRFDPRCHSCNSVECLNCMDLLLWSIRRSGRRPHDPILPPDELSRQLAYLIPFGSQQSNAFDEAELYRVIRSDITPLNASAISCHQGLNSDESFDCEPTYISNIVCGHEGTFTLSSPEYSVKENEDFIRLSVRRSGGGVGTASVSYAIEHITTEGRLMADVSPTAMYTRSQTLTFNDNEVEKTFLLPVHNDITKEGNENFSVHLFDPTGGSSLGIQSKAVITIIDDDEECKILVLTSSSSFTIGTIPHVVLDREGCISNGFHNNMFSLAVHRLDDDERWSLIYNFTKEETVTKIYLPELKSVGRYNINMYRIVPSGLHGTYFADVTMTQPIMSRLDPMINMTWSQDLGAAMRWIGFVQSFPEETSRTYHVVYEAT